MVSLKNSKRKTGGLQFTRTDYLSLLLTPLRIRWTIPLMYVVILKLATMLAPPVLVRSPLLLLRPLRIYRLELPQLHHRGDEGSSSVGPDECGPNVGLDECDGSVGPAEDGSQCWP